MELSVDYIYLGLKKDILYTKATKDIHFRTYVRI